MLYVWYDQGSHQNVVRPCKKLTFIFLLKYNKM